MRPGRRELLRHGAAWCLGTGLLAGCRADGVTSLRDDIAGGWVEVDGKVVEEPAFRVSDNQRVTLRQNAQRFQFQQQIEGQPPGAGSDFQNIAARRREDLRRLARQRPAEQ